MADKNTIKNWFKTNLKPTQAQFWALFDSYRHNDEKIPITAIDDIENILAEKADAEVLVNHLTNETAHADLFGAKEDKSKRGAALGYAPLNEFTKLAIDYLNVVNDLVTGGESSLLTAEQGKLLQVQITAINTLLTSDNVNLDNVQEIVDAIETVQMSLSSILVNDLTTGGTTKALTAEMGKTLKGLIDGLVVPTATDTVRGSVKTDVTVADPVVYVKETVDELLKAKANYFLGIKPITGISYNVIMGATIEDGDILKQLVYDGTLPMSVIIPNNATVPFPIGTIFYTVATNTGVLSISGGTGVTFQTSVGLSAAQNEVRKYTKRGTNTWGVEGGVSASLSLPLPLVVDTPNSKVSVLGKFLVGPDNSFSVEQVTSTNPRITKIIADKKSGTSGAGWLSNLEFYTKDGDTERLSMSIEGGTIPTVKIQGNFQVLGSFIQNYLNLTPVDLRILDAGLYGSESRFKIERSFGSPYENIDFNFASTRSGGWYERFRFLIKGIGDSASYSALEIENTAVNGKAKVTLTGDLAVSGGLTVNSITIGSGGVALSKVVLNPIDNVILSGGTYSEKVFNINRSTGSPYENIDFDLSTNKAGGWYAKFRFLIKGLTDSASYSALEIENTAVNGKSLVTVNGTLKTQKIDLTQLGSYADDSAAASAGVGVGYGYINSSTGAMHRRLT